MNKTLLIGLTLALGGCASTSPSCTGSLSSEHCRTERLLYQNDLMQARILIAVANPDGYPLAAALLERSAQFDQRGETDFYQALLAIRREQPATEILPLLEKAAAKHHPHAIALLYKVYEKPMLIDQPDPRRAQHYREAYSQLGVARSGYPSFEKALEVVTQLVEPPPGTSTE